MVIGRSNDSNYPVLCSALQPSATRLGKTLPYSWVGGEPEKGSVRVQVNPDPVAQ